MLNTIYFWQASFSSSRKLDKAEQVKILKIFYLPNTNAFMITAEIVMPTTKRSRTYMYKFGAKATPTPKMACAAKPIKMIILRPYLK